MNKVKTFVKKYWVTVLIFAGLIGLYYYSTEFGNANPFLFPKVSSIAKVYASDKHLMVQNLWASFKMMIPAVVISLALALSLGTFLGLNKKAREALHPVIYTFSVVPAILLSPFVLLIAPNMFVASIILIVYSTVWATLFATITGIQTIDKSYLDKAATLELTGFEKFFKVILPAASPSILAGFVNSLRNTFIMLVYAEMYGAQYGMGYYVKKFADFGMYNKVWLGFVFMVIVMVIVMQLFEKLKDRLLKWTIN
jgi:NitT/TauT family transport system permease protein